MQPFVSEQFPGLDLRADPGDTPGAIDAMNVTLEPGRIRTRDGGALFYGAVNKPYYLERFQFGSSSQLIVGEAGGAVRALNASGSSIAATTVPVCGSAGLTGVAVGTPTNAYFYVGDLSTVNGIRRWDGATWSTPAAFAAIPALGAIAVSPSDNRLVLCYGSTVRFSDPGAPETLGASNTVTLTPGDGESITGAVAFNNQLFVFKQTKFFVFYGTSTGSAGQPVFNYRAVDSGVGMVTGSPKSVCRSNDSVYFIGYDGVYRTTGGNPTKVSAPIEPFFTNRTNAYWRGTNGANWVLSNLIQRLSWINNKLYASFGDTTAGTDRAQMFVFDPEAGGWTAWGMNACSFADFPPVGASPSGAAKQLVVGSAAGSGDYAVTIHRAALTADTDANGVSTSIVSRYRSAFNGFSSPGRKRLKETVLEGTGTPLFRWTADWDSFLAAGTAVTLGGVGAIATGRHRTSYRGREFSFLLEAASGAWSLYRLEPIFSSPPRAPSVTSS